jgi:hypothetical protein
LAPTYHIDADNLAVGLLDLAELHQKVPESGLGNDLVRGEDPHAVQLRGRVGLGGQVAPDDLVFGETTCFIAPSESGPPSSSTIRVAGSLQGIGVGFALETLEKNWGQAGK